MQPWRPPQQHGRPQEGAASEVAAAGAAAAAAAMTPTSLVYKPGPAQAAVDELTNKAKTLLWFVCSSSWPGTHAPGTSHAVS